MQWKPVYMDNDHFIWCIKKDVTTKLDWEKFCFLCVHYTLYIYVNSLCLLIHYYASRGYVLAEYKIAFLYFKALTKIYLLKCDEVLVNVVVYLVKHVQMNKCFSSFLFTKIAQFTFSNNLYKSSSRFFSKATKYLNTIL